MRWVRGHRLRWLGVLVMLPGVSMFAFCWWHNVWSFDGWYVYGEMKKECGAAWRDYHFGRVRAGDDVEEVIRKTKPAMVERKGRYVFLKYTRSGEAEPRVIHFTNLTGIAYDGRMVLGCAMSCMWARVFFDHLTDDQNRELRFSPSTDPTKWGLGKVVR